MVPEHLGGLPRETPQVNILTPTSLLASVFSSRGVPWGPLGLGPTPRWAALVSWRWFGSVVRLAHGARVQAHKGQGIDKLFVPGSPRPRWHPPNLIELVLLVNVLVFLLILLVNLPIFWDSIGL